MNNPFRHHIMEYAIFEVDGSYTIRTNSFENESMFDVAKRTIDPSIKLQFFSCQIPARYAFLHGLNIRKRYYMYTSDKKNRLGLDVNTKYPLISGNFVLFSSDGKLSYHEAEDIARHIYIKRVKKSKCICL